MSAQHEWIWSLSRLSVISAIAGISFVLLFYTVYKLALPKPIPGIPYSQASANSPLGNVGELLAYAREHGVIRQWFADYARKPGFSPIYQCWRGPFQQPTIVLTDYQECQDILLRRNKEFDRTSIGTDRFARVLGNGHIAMATTDPKFRENKELLRDLMGPKFLNDINAPEIYKKAMILVDLWKLKAEVAGGKPFHALQDYYNVAMDTINAATFAFDDSMSVMNQQKDYLQSLASGTRVVPTDHDTVEFARTDIPEDTTAMVRLSNHLGDQLVSILPGLAHRWRMLTDRQLRQSYARKDRLIRTEIEKSLARMDRGDYSMFSATDNLLQREMNAAKKAGREPNPHRREIYDELFGYIIGGYETIAAGVAWMTKFLSNYQAEQDKLRSALRISYSQAVQEARLPTAAEITTTSVPYLDAFIEESLRFAPPFPLIVRDVTVDTTLLGHDIPRGATLFLACSGPGFKLPGGAVPDTQRSKSSREKNWGGQWNLDDMNLFKPDRWLREDGKGGSTFDAQAGPFLGFGMGVRGCFGRRLAYLELKIILVLLVWTFEFKELTGKIASEDMYDAFATQPRYPYVAINIGKLQ